MKISNDDYESLLLQAEKIGHFERKNRILYGGDTNKADKYESIFFIN